VVTLAIGIPLGIHFGPVVTFIFLATILTGIMIAIYMIFNLSCLVFYAHKARREFNWLRHAIIPVLGSGVPARLVHRDGHRPLGAEIRRAA
jgi:hypothetical protein